MSTYNEEKIFEKARRNGTVLTPVPEELTINWEAGGGFFFNEVFDGHSLLWVPVLMETFNEVIPEENWLVDDPGFLYSENPDFEEAEESPVPLERMQEAADLALSHYAMLYERLVDAGHSVDEV